MSKQAGAESHTKKSQERPCKRNGVKEMEGKRSWRESEQLCKREKSTHWQSDQLCKRTRKPHIG